ncbi:Mitogen-activated protein kinase kinase kinase, partial [Thalictrum thalictroides]
NGVYQNNYKNTEQVDAQSTKSPTDRGKKVRQEQNSYVNVQNNFRQNASAAMSAPGSGLSSPSLSPRRMSSGDSYPFPNGVTQGFIWSAPEMAAMDPFCQVSSKETWSYAERSPCHGSGLNSKNSSGAASQLYPRFSPDGSSSRQENNSQAQVHNLPLPPVLAVSPPKPLAHHSLIRPEVTPMVSQWQKGKLIGRGTFGSVYVATNRETGALCAMKEVALIPDDPKSAECMKQLEQEIKVLSQLKHPNIVQYYGSEIVGDRFYIYLEYVYPGSINKYVREHYGAITESVVRNFTRHILSGLAYLHSTKTVHRDIKGANLLVDASGVVKLADFGMAKHLTGQAAELSMKGSPYWMAPEIIHAVNSKDNNGEFPFAVDIWSLGCTIIEIVNGKPPWSEYEGAAAMFKVWKETPPIPETLSPSGKDFLRCCFTRNPGERPSASMLLEHHFLKNSYQPEFQAFTESFSAMKLGDTQLSPREWTTKKADSMPGSPRTHTTKGKHMLLKLAMY